MRRIRIKKVPEPSPVVGGDLAGGPDMTVVLRVANGGTDAIPASAVRADASPLNQLQNEMAHAAALRIDALLLTPPFVRPRQLNLAPTFPIYDMQVEVAYDAAALSYIAVAQWKADPTARNHTGRAYARIPDADVRNRAGSAGVQGLVEDTARLLADQIILTAVYPLIERTLRTEIAEHVARLEGTTSSGGPRFAY